MSSKCSTDLNYFRLQQIGGQLCAHCPPAGWHMEGQIAGGARGGRGGGGALLYVFPPQHVVPHAGALLSSQGEGQVGACIGAGSSGGGGMAGPGS